MQKTDWNVFTIAEIGLMDGSWWWPIKMPKTDKFFFKFLAAPPQDTYKKLDHEINIFKAFKNCILSEYAKMGLTHFSLLKNRK